MPNAYTFENGALPPEAFQYHWHMGRFGLSKSDAKRAVQQLKGEVIHVSVTYQVNQIGFGAPAPFKEGQWLSVKRRDKEPLPDRSALGHIMRALLPGFHGYELFPAPERLVDTANQYHLWCFSSDCLFEQAEAPAWEQVFPAAAGERTVLLAELRPVPKRVSAPLQVLRILKKDGAPEQDWRVLQDIKESLFPNREGATLHHAVPEHPLQGLMLVLTQPGSTWPFGFTQGRVAGTEAALLAGAKQREFGE